MPLWNAVTDLVSRAGVPLTCTVVPPDHCTPPIEDGGPISAGQRYFRLWLTAMSLRSGAEWFRTYYPVVQSLAVFSFGAQPTPTEIAHVAGPTYLKQIDATALDRVVQLDHALTPLVPFSGGTVQLQVALVAVQADDVLKRFLDVMGGFASLLAVPQFSSVVAVAGAVSDGVASLLGLQEQAMKLGYMQTFVGAGDGGANVLSPSYIVVAGASPGALPPEQLWVRDGALLVGTSLASAQPPTGVDAMVIRIETRADRDDWEALAAINDPWTLAVSTLGQIDATGQPEIAAADAYVKQAVVAALNSADLTQMDRMRVSRALWEKWKEYKALAFPDPGASAEKGLGPLPSSPRLPPLAAVARGAGPYDTSPLTLDTLFRT